MDLKNLHGNDVAVEASVSQPEIARVTVVPMAAPPTDDQILYWNNVALEANRVAHTTGADKGVLGPVLSARALAITHLAMYDAYVGTSTTMLQHYLTSLPSAAPGASTNAAIAQAAYDTLSALFPSQMSFFALKLVEAGITGPGIPAGQAYGSAVASAILSDRAADPDASSVGFVPPVGRGKHKPDPDNPDQGFYAPFFGAKSKGFAISERHELDSPYALNSTEYINAVKQVRGKGIAPELIGTLPDNIEARTAEETLIGIYWGYDGAKELGTPPRFYNQIIRKLAKKRGNSPEENAQLFAFINVAMADAGILAWDQKYIHNFWRPVIGVREHDKSMGAPAIGGHNIDPLCDPSWLPLGAPKTNGKDEMNLLPKNFTPNFPAYPSGHATFGAAALHITRLFYHIPSGDRNPDSLLNDLEFVSEECNGINKDNKGTVRVKHTRVFPGGLAQMIEENGFSRVFLGVHWHFDAFALKPNGMPDYSKKKIGGVQLGLKIAEDIFANKMSKSTVPPRS